jgi:hypothetical protein
MDENRTAEFTGRVLADSAAVATIVLAALDSRTGLARCGGQRWTTRSTAATS